MKRTVTAVTLLTMLSLVSFLAFKNKDDKINTISSPIADCSTAKTQVAKVVCAAENFKATLSAEQVATMQLEYTQDQVIRWSNLPCGSRCRNGIQFSTLNATQLAAAKKVVQVAMGTAANEGYEEVMQILAADDVLSSARNERMYSSGIYFMAFLGTPSTTGTWMLQFGGHHLGVNITFEKGAVTSASPMFEGVEPKTWTTNGKTYSPLAGEQSTMAAMLTALSSTQLASAKLNTAFRDVLLGPHQDGKFPATKVGLAVSSLSKAQKQIVLAAIKPWVQDANSATAASLLSTYERELDKTFIAYSGNASLTDNADYVRIDGPSVWIEFVCQNGVVYPDEIHYHSVWRDHIRDYGGNFTF